MVQSKIKKRSNKSNKISAKGGSASLGPPIGGASPLAGRAGGKKILTQPQLNSEEIKGDVKIKFMATKDILEKAKKELADLTGFKSPSAIGFKKEGDELIATIEVIEKESIPDGMDVLGTYEVRVDDGGKIIEYKRTDLRKRVDTALNAEA